MWRIAVVAIAFVACLVAAKNHYKLEAERAVWAAERGRLEETLADLRRASERPSKSTAPSDDELRSAAEKVFGDLQPEPELDRPVYRPAEPGLPYVKEPELRAQADVSWGVVERNNTWHRLSYTVTLRSAVSRTLTVDLNVKVLNTDGLTLKDSDHRNIVLPADGQQVQIRDYMLVSCPACQQIFDVGGDIKINAAR